MVRYYFAYGMNTNAEQMAHRCPNAKFLGTAKLSNARLVFRHVADYEIKQGYTLHGALWLITPECEKALDSLEGFPTFYTKHIVYPDIKVRHGIRQYKSLIEGSPVMIYQMVNGYDNSRPSKSYFDCLLSGYKKHGLPLAQLFASKKQARKHQQFSFADISGVNRA